MVVAKDFLNDDSCARTKVRVRGQGSSESDGRPKKIIMFLRANQSS